MAIRRLAVRVLALGLALAGMEGPHAQGTRFGKGAGPGVVLDFGARCSEPGHSWGGYWQAYGHFASADGRAQVLARILVGRIGVQSGERIAAALEDVVIRTGRGGMEVAFRLEGSGIRGGEAQASAWSTRYRASPRGGGYPEPWGVRDERARRSALEPDPAQGERGGAPCAPGDAGARRAELGRTGDGPAADVGAHRRRRGTAGARRAGPGGGRGVPRPGAAGDEGAGSGGDAGPDRERGACGDGSVTPTATATATNGAKRRGRRSTGRRTSRQSRNAGGKDAGNTADAMHHRPGSPAPRMDASSAAAAPVADHPLDLDLVVLPAILNLVSTLLAIRRLLAFGSADSSRRRMDERPEMHCGASIVPGNALPYS